MVLPILFIVPLLFPLLDAQAQDEDQQFLCPAIGPDLAKRVASEIKGNGLCQTFCRGCGCKGGPGFRASDGECVKWADVVTKCGPAPHAGCDRECVPVAKACVGHVFGRVWLKAFAATVGQDLKFLPADPPRRRGPPSITATPDK